MSRLTFCLSEDRDLSEVGLRFAILSLTRHAPAAEVVVYRPKAGDDFRRWVSAFSNVKHVPELPPGASSWNCKPHVLLPLLREGRESVIWLDSDIIVARGCEHVFAGLGPSTIGVAQEQISSADQGTERRTRGWGFPVGRTFPRTMNTCVLRVTREHVPLLERWEALLADPRYVHAQTRPFDERPIHFLGDQDVLNALLGSEEFAALPVHFFLTGRDLIHSGGALAYSLGERLRGLFGRTPPFVHGQGTKLWWAFDAHALRENRGSWWFVRRLLLETSPYFAEVKRYADQVGTPCPWMRYGTALGRLNRALGFGHFALRGLPLTLAATLADALSGWRPRHRPKA